MIPKTIHYCWFGGKPLPIEVKRCIKSWKRQCPDYEIVRWDESNFDVYAHPFTKSAYKAGKWAFVTDYARLKIIYENGGIYLDTDVELLKSPDFLRKRKCYVGVCQGTHLCNTGLGFGAERFNPVIRMMMDEYEGLSYSADAEKDIICPLIQNRTLKRLGYLYEDEPLEIEGLLVLPPRYLDPFSIGKKAENLLCEDTVSIHNYSASWCGKRVAFRRKVFSFVGQEKISTVKSILKKARNCFGRKEA